MKTLLYDLGNRPASYDFVTCLSSAVALGFDHVRFVLGKWKKKNYHSPEERFKSIVEPAVGLFGLTYSVGPREGIEINHLFPTALEVYKHTGKNGKIRAVCEDKGYVTVTLRKSPGRTPERDSKEDEWMEFASRCDRKVIVIRDWDERPITLEDRMKLYAGAHLNMMVINGPLTLCIHSDAPYVSMRTIGGVNSDSTSPAFMARLGITPGFQFPWAHSRQRLSYLDDTAANIMAEYHNLSRLKEAA